MGTRTDIPPQTSTRAGVSPRELALRAARSTCTILLRGETGVGKGWFARWIHDHSPRADRPFVPVNCGAIPDSLIDSQLFGHERGAFSGAVADHLGLVRAADRGTLFLDEIGELPASAQVRLLRLLQDGEVQPVGRSRPMRVDVRIIAATNADLAIAVAERRFREDLLFRLDVVGIPVPPLRDRLEEIPGLVARFNAEFAEQYAQPRLDFDDAAMRLLDRFPWPGNIRQLRTVVERLHVLCPDEPVTAERLVEIGQLEMPAAVRPAPADPEPVRREDLERLLREVGGSVTEVARRLGVHRSTIYRWLRSHHG